MKKLMFGVTGLLFLSIQVNAQHASSAGGISTPVHPSAPTRSYSYSHGSKSTTVTTGTNTSISVSTNGKNTYSYSSDSSGVQSQDQDDPVKSKTFSKSFSIDRNDKVFLNNQFGTITVKTWSKNEVKVDVDIKAYAKTDEDAQKLLDDVSISANKNGDVITFKTEMERREGNFGRSIKNGKTIWRREAKINYVVYLPATAALNASQQYGNIEIGDFAGPTSIKVSYGNLTAGNLSHANNNINVQYGKTTIEKVNEAIVRHQYGSGVNIGAANELEVDAQYVGVNLGSVKGNVNVKAQYGSGVKIVSAGSFTLTAQYVGVRMERLNGNFTGKLQYGGGLNISSIEPGCKIFNCDAEYAGVSLGFTPGYSANATIATRYGSFKYPADMNVKKLGDNDDRWSNDRKYTAQIGKGGPNIVQINSTYQGVTFR